MVSKRSLWVTTELQVEQVIFQWSITSFSCLQMRSGEKIESPVFHGHDKSISWRLGLYPFADIVENEEYVSVHLELRAANAPEMSIKYKLAIVNHQGEKTHLWTNDIRLNPNKSWGVNIINRNALFTKYRKCLLPKNTFTLHAELEYVNGYKYHGSIMSQSGTGCTQRVMSLYPGLLTLQQNAHFCDLTIVVGDTKFLVHRVILAAASPVFASMLKQEISEKRAGQVQINDLKPQTFATLINLIYGSEIPTFNQSDMESVEELLMATDMYQIRELKSLMETSISHMLSVENASSILAIADRYNAPNLKNNAIKFIKNSKSDVMATKQWHKEMARNPVLFTDLLKLIFE